MSEARNRWREAMARRARIYCIPIAFLLLVVLAVVLFRRATTNPESEVSIEPSAIDLGRVLQYSTHQAVFTVSNHSPQGLDLSLKYKSCSCFDVKLEKTRVEPWGNSRVTLTIDTGDAARLFKSTVILGVRSPTGERNLSASVQLRPERAALLNPNRLDLGVVSPDQRVSTFITIQKSDWPVEWNKVVAHSKLNGPLDVRKIDNGMSVNYVANLHDAPLGGFKDMVLVDLLGGNSRLVQELCVPVDAVVSTNIDYTPKSVFLSVKRPGAEVTGILNIATSDKRPIKLNSATSDLKFEYHCEQPQSNLLRIAYSMTLPTLEQTINSRLILNVEAGQPRRIDIPIIGYVQR